jgi:hypothetical protein
MLLMHWDGNNWSEVSATGGAGGTLVSRGGHLFAVGDRISQWNGNSWTVIDPLTELSYPSLVSAIVFSNGDIWSCGRTFDSSFHSLVYRTANSIPQFHHGGSQSLYAGYALQNVDELLKIEDADLNQVVVYSLTSPPSYGVLSGLPDTAITSNGFATPSSVSYSRNAGYTGSDQFVVKASVGSLSSVTTINVGPLVALPVTLDNYSVIKTGSTTTIEWTSSTETNTKEFIVERSGDGINFGPIRKTATHGAGLAYKIVDQFPMPGWNYYRLKLVDLDNRENIFAARRIKFDASELKPFIVRQNPVINKMLNIQLNIDGKFIFSLHDQQGRQQMTGVLYAPGNINVSLPETIPAGGYTLIISNNNGRWMEKLVIE